MYDNPIVCVLGILLLCGVVSAVLIGIEAIIRAESNWDRLAASYPYTSLSIPFKRKRFQSLLVNMRNKQGMFSFIGYRSELEYILERDGIGIRQMFTFGPRYKPFLLPWNSLVDMNRKEWGYDIFAISSMPDVLIGLPDWLSKIVRSRQ